ncbi:MAG TPA: SDR family oxidoreductase [Afifellaceae bacterium]|nr:SDR family oxidoreductase [Afifellaceae bacterium]
MSSGDRRVYIIGASRGIGAAIAQRMAGDGYALTLTSREPNGPVRDILEKVRQSGAGADHRICRLDVNDRDLLEQMADMIQTDDDLYGLVYVVGQSYDMLSGAVDYDVAGDLMTTNFMGFLRLSTAALRPMIRAKSGRIVAIGSLLATYGTSGNAVYAATKGAMLGYARTMAVEVARKGVTVNYIAPGFVDTALLDPYRAYLGRLIEKIPAARVAKPEEIAGLVAYLLSVDAAYVTGSVLTIDGGLSANLVSRR